MTQADAWIDFTETKSDWLGRAPVVVALRRMLSSPDLPSPLVVGVYGGWGTGKTSLMRTLRAALDGPGRTSLWFDAWIYARQEEALWRALLLRVIEALRLRTRHPDELHLLGAAHDAAKREFDAFWSGPDDARDAAEMLDDATASLYRSLASSEKGRLRFNWAGALPLAADAALTALTAGLSNEIAKAIVGKDGPGGPMAAVAKWFKGSDTKEVIKLFEREATERYVAQVNSLEQFQNTFQAVIKRFGIGVKERGDQRLFIFIDDLDRCLPEDAVSALEAVKLFFDLQGCVFVLGMDRVIVEQGIVMRYKDLRDAGFDSRAYLDKIIQVPFNLPLLGASQIDAYLDQAAAKSGLAACRDLIRRASPANPRTLKRALNALLVTFYLAGHSDQSLAALSEENSQWERYLAKLVLLQVCFEPVWLQVAAGTLDLRTLETTLRGPVRDGTSSVEGLPALSDQQRRRLGALFSADPPFAGLSQDKISNLLTVVRPTGRPSDDALVPH
jgi:hypothetical protein